MGGCCIWHNGIRLSVKRKWNIRGQPCILLSVLFFFFFQNPRFPIWNVFIYSSIWVRMLKSKLCTEQLILQVCNMRHYLLLLHNFDPGYHYKIMLKMRREMLKRNIIHPVLRRHHIQVKLNLAKAGVLRHATSYTECERTRVSDMCSINIISCPGYSKIATRESSTLIWFMWI